MMSWVWTVSFEDINKFSKLKYSVDGMINLTEAQFGK